MQTYPTIYKRNQRGKILFWFIEREGDHYRTVSGQEGGAEKRSAFTYAKAKNVGKKNETTPEEQAELEVAAKYEKKLSREYHESIDDVDTVRYVIPMLAEPYYSPATQVSREKDNKPTPEEYQKGIFGQPKLDGIRCIARKEGLFSREGKEFVSCPHISEALAPLFDAKPDLILDGELYNHDLKDDFNSIVSLIRRQKLSEEDLAKSKKYINYYVYDLPSSPDSYTCRFKDIALYLGSKDIEEPIYWLDAVVLVDEEDTESYLEECLEAGYEGIMLRKGWGLYENKRTKNLLKYKLFVDEEFIIEDILEGEGNNAGMAAKIEIHLEDGTVVYPNMTGSWEYCREVLENKDQYIGAEVTVTYFGKTPDGSLRFPRVKQIYLEGRDV